MTRYAIVRDGLVENIVEWDGETDWTPPEGSTVKALPDDSPVSPGWGRAGNGRWTAPVVTVIDTTVQQALAVVQAQVDPEQSNPDPAVLMQAIAVLLIDQE